MLSARADADEIMRWLKGFRSAPRTTFITHGEPAASDALRHRIEEELGWPCIVAEQGQQVDLSRAPTFRSWPRPRVRTSRGPAGSASIRSMKPLFSCTKTAPYAGPRGLRPTHASCSRPS